MKTPVPAARLLVSLFALALLAALPVPAWSQACAPSAPQQFHALEVEEDRIKKWYYHNGQDDSVSSNVQVVIGTVQNSRVGGGMVSPGSGWSMGYPSVVLSQGICQCIHDGKTVKTSPVEINLEAVFHGIKADPGSYTITIHPNNQAYAQTLVYSFNPTDTAGPVRFRFLDPNGVVVPAVNVTMNLRWSGGQRLASALATSDVDGKASVENVYEGTWVATVTPPSGGGSSGTLNVVSSPGNPRIYTVRVGNGAPYILESTYTEEDDEINGDGDGGGFAWPLDDWWEAMFTPSDTTAAQWDATRDRVKNWGPFGLYTSVQQAFEYEPTALQSELVWTMPIFFNGVTNNQGEGQPATMPFKLDLRPEIVGCGSGGQAPYSDGSCGSALASGLQSFRFYAGAIVYAVFFLVVILKLIPKLRT